MKKIVSVLLAAVLISAFVGCSASGRHSDSDGTGNPVESTPSSDIPSEPNDDGAPQKDAKLLRLIEEFPIDEIPLPDGTTVSKNEAVGADENSQTLRFDFAFIRYAAPIFENTFDDPNSFDWDTFQFAKERGSVENPKWIKVKAGDTLENGLTVTSASSEYLYSEFFDYFSCTGLSADGSLEFDGIIMKTKADETYGLQPEGDLLFYPNGSKAKVPLLYENTVLSTVVDPATRTALLYDGQPLYVGNVDELPFDFAEVFADGDYSRVSISVKELSLANSGTMLTAANGGTAVLMKIKPL